ncbi:MAG: hemerythrin domain-containing protein [Roseburia sp.]
MDCIDLMIKEHDNILLLVQTFRNACCRMIEGEAVSQDDFREMIAVARTYADAHHHGKEEKILFRAMTEHLGQIAVNLIQHGMLVEHDLGRFHLYELEEALKRHETDPSAANKLDIITHAGGWANLLQRHIDKENDAVYSYARRALPPDVLKEVETETAQFEADAETGAVVGKAIETLNQLYKKYC